MSIRPIDFNGMVQRTQDVSTMKQNADNKPVFEQQVLVNKMQKDTQLNMKQVNHGEDAQNHQKKYDAREKGSNEYEGSHNERGKKEEKKEGKVVKKAAYGSFDIKI